jgi:beta-RFAP synthase
MALAVGAAVMRLAGHVATSADIAERLGRGARSGIGVLGFEHGGLIVDGGPGRAPGRSGVATLPPLLSRHAFPDAWRILLIDDTTREGLHGDDERRGLAALAPFPATLAAHLCHLVLMRVLPGIAQADFSAFADGIGEIQQTIGEYFAPVQGGVFASPAVAQALNAVRDACPAGIGQTSWGPTGFAFLPDARTAERALAIARDALSDAPGVVCSIAAGRNRGAWLRAEDGEPHRQQCRAGTA